MQRLLLLFAFVLTAAAASAQANAGPLRITSFNGDAAVMSGFRYSDLMQGQTINIQGDYDLTSGGSTAQMVVVSYSVFNEFYSELLYNHTDTVAMGAELDGMINYDFTFPADAATFASFGGATVWPLVQIRVFYEPVIDTYYNLFVDVIEGDATSIFDAPDAIAGFAAYPNPAAGGVLNVRTAAGRAEYAELLDPNGRLLRRQALNGDGPVNVADLRPGLYVLRVAEAGKVGAARVFLR